MALSGFIKKRQKFYLEECKIKKKYLFINYCIFALTIFLFLGYSSGCANESPSSFIEELKKKEKKDDIIGEDIIDENMKSVEKNAEESYKKITDAGEKRYYNAINEIQNPPQQTSKKGFSYFTKGLYMAVYKFFSTIRIMAIPIILISEIIGIVGVWMSQKNKRNKRFFIYTVCIGIPFLVLLSIFGYGSLTEVFY